MRRRRHSSPRANGVPRRRLAAAPGPKPRTHRNRKVRIMAHDLLKALHVSAAAGGHIVRSPIDGAEIGRVAFDDAKSIDAKIAKSADAFRAWAAVPAPKRGELVR